MNKQIKFLLFACMAISVFTFINCNNSTENNGANTVEDTKSVEESHSDANGDVSALNVKVVRKTRDEVTETVDCSGNLNCYSVSGTDNDQVVEVQFCTNNISTNPEPANVIFVINQTDTVSLNIPNVPVGKSSAPYTTNKTNISGPITSVSVNINDEGASSISLCGS
ncbi:MAG: hypothetical protein R2788_16075 [Saprospiraceae bacterium]